MWLFYYLLWAMLLTYGLYVFYCATMNLKRLRDNNQLNGFNLILGYPTLLIGFILDFLCNVFVMTVLFLELPQEYTVTSRLKRHFSSGLGWRCQVSVFFKKILDPIDPTGRHV